MKNMLRFLFLSLVFVSCQQKIQQNDILKINGYWEIEKVVFEDEKEKKYGVNESYDYFQVDKNNQGFRKKVLPQLNGTFLINDTQESIKVRLENDRAYIDYATLYSKWSEEFVSISNEQLVLKTAENREYHYKKATPLTIIQNGKETK